MHYVVQILIIFLITTSLTMAKCNPMSWLYDTHLVLTNVDENCTESARSFITFNSSLGLDVNAPGKKIRSV